MKQISAGPVITLILVIAAFMVGINVSHPQPPRPNNVAPATNTRRAAGQDSGQEVAEANSATPTKASATSAQTQPAATRTATIRPTTALATFTPSRTLKPPPTFEPPTATVLATLTPVPTASPTLDLSINIPGLNGNESPTPASTAGCVPRKEWKLTYTVQRGDALARIADVYNTSVSELLKANCLTNADLIVTGQTLKVPGTTQPVTPSVVCGPFELSTPLDNTQNVEGGGNLTFDWHGPRAPYNLIRVTRPDGSIWERVLDLRQNETVDAYKEFNPSGTYKWQVFPLDSNYQQVCPEGPIWYFTKATAPTATPTQKSVLGP
ncbi:MAG: LysM peptidoglycan-binding domain-containing protein [Chloroflexota bacterium]